MIILSSKIRNLSIALLVFAALSLLLIGRRITIFEPNIDTFSLSDEAGLTESELRTKLTLDVICQPVSNTTIPNVRQENMALVMTGVDYSNVTSLAEFCKPYIYTRFMLRLGPKTTDECAEEAAVRGTHCEWYHMCVWPESEDIYISRRIILGGIWEEEMIRIAIQVMDGKKTGIVIDAGANIGQYTLTAALLGHRVFAFEPIPQHVDMIKRSLALNGISNRVHVFCNGLSDYNARTHINFHKDNKGGSTIERLDSKDDETITDTRFIPGSRIDIDLVTLDDVLPIMNELYPNMHVVYWKADIEGYEPRMFRGAWRFIEHKKPPFITFEILGKSFDRTKCKLPNLFHALLKLDYTVKMIDEGGKYVEQDDIDAVSNLIITAKLHRDVVLQLKSSVRY